MGKNEKAIANPEAPCKLTLEERYDPYFRERLLQVIRDDFERFLGGVPTYHAFMLKTVESRVGKSLNVNALSQKDLANFLKGMASHTPRIKILDAYVQIQFPGLRNSFLPSGYIDRIGSAFADYYSDRHLNGELAAIFFKKMAGVYKVLTDDDGGRVFCH